MEAFELEPIVWDLDLRRGDWRVEASLGVNRSTPFAGIRLAQYATQGPARTRRFRIWEESLIVIPSTPQTAMIAIGNVLSGGINHMYEEMARLNAEESRRRHEARHRRT